MSHPVEVAFKGTRRGYFQVPPEGDPVRIGDLVLVEAERGRDLGRVTAVGEVADRKCGGCAGCAAGSATESEPAAPRRAVLRRATPEELRILAVVRRSEDDVRRKVMERVRVHQLVMKVSDTEWQFDRNRLTIYFTAEKRVDFRALVRDLASTFRTRIELRQIGVRDEAARLGGVGRCGREYCCSTWLKELSPVNLGLAKDQHLSLNPSQISGGCGRLLCCLRYEHEFYVTARKRFPKEGKTLRTAVGAEKVVAVDIFRERVFLRSEEYGSRIITLAQLREEVEGIGEVLLTPEYRARLAAEGVPGAEAATSAAAVQPAPATPNGNGASASEVNRRRRRRRGSGPSNPPPA